MSYGDIINIAPKPNLTVVHGVGPDAPIIADPRGYRTSTTPYRMDLMPGAALLKMAEVMAEGAISHGEGNWRLGTVEGHLNKMLVHAFAYLAGDRSDEHIAHMAWRAMAALEISLTTPPEPPTAA